MSRSAHIEIISALTELYTLLSTSGAIASDRIILPNPTTGLHPPGTIARQAALAAGFLQEVVDLLSALPYLDVSKYETRFELLPGTFPITYYGQELDKSYFKGWREMPEDREMPPSAIKLTHNELYGIEYIYDVKTKLVTPWDVMAGPGGKRDYFDVPAKSPHEAFRDVIENFRSLNYLGTPLYVDFNTGYFSKYSGKPPRHYSEHDTKRWLAGHDIWAATRKIKDIYLDCGWDVKGYEQPNFRRDEFIRRRNEYWENVVMRRIEKDRWKAFARAVNANSLQPSGWSSRDMETMGVAMKLHGHWKQIQSLSWSRCGRYLLTASQDCRATLWDLATQTRLRSAKFEAPIYTAELHPYNAFLFVVSLFEDKPYLVDITDPIAIHHRLPTTPLSDTGLPSESKQATTSAIFSTNGNHIITGTSKGFINIIETATRRIIHSSKISTGLFSLLRLTSSGRQLLANSTDRIIRVINMPDLSLLPAISSPDPQSSSAHHDQPQPPPPVANDDPDSSNTPSSHLDPSTLYLSVEHKFQDLVNRLRWNHAAISPTSSSTATATATSLHADYVTASTYMKRDIYIWELRTNSLLRILEASHEPAIIEWHPSRPILACTSIETGSIQIWGIEPQQKWSALAPDFTEVTENVEYIEREDEFDIYPDVEHDKRRKDREDEEVDVLTVDKKEGTEESFVLPMLYDVEDSEVDDQELVRMGVGTLRKKDVNEGKEYEEDGDGAVVAAANAKGMGKKRK
ncbi:hypothetical protein DV738_g3888, partial [Chaetothyriales sp. CBS 135597]